MRFSGRVRHAGTKATRRNTAEMTKLTVTSSHQPNILEGPLIDNRLFWAGNFDGECRVHGFAHPASRVVNVARGLDLLFDFSFYALGVVFLTEFFGGVVAVVLQGMNLAAEATQRGDGPGKCSWVGGELLFGFRLGQELGEAGRSELQPDLDPTADRGSEGRPAADAQRVGGNQETPRGKSQPDRCPSWPASASEKAVGRVGDRSLNEVGAARPTLIRENGCPVRQRRGSIQRVRLGHAGEDHQTQIAIGRE